MEGFAAAGDPDQLDLARITSLLFATIVLVLALFWKAMWRLQARAPSHL